MEVGAESGKKSWLLVNNDLLILLSNRRDLLELDRKPGMLSPRALTFSKSQSDKISISDTFIVGKCS